MVERKVRKACSSGKRLSDLLHGLAIGFLADGLDDGFDFELFVLGHVAAGQNHEFKQPRQCQLFVFVEVG